VLCPGCQSFRRDEYVQADGKRNNEDCEPQSYENRRCKHADEQHGATNEVSDNRLTKTLA
jgi:hypothetical protein